MFAITPISAIIYGVLFCFTYYCAISAVKKRWVVINVYQLLFYVSLFCLFGIAGEIFVNTLWSMHFGAPLWDYHLFPAQNGHISYFFPLIWGALGFYKLINDTAFPTKSKNKIIPGLIMGTEAIFLEIAFNGLFLLLFGSYIFFYLPANLGILSHLSCLEVIPFYFVVGVFTHYLVTAQNKIGYGPQILPRIGFYSMVIFAILLI